MKTTFALIFVGCVSLFGLKVHAQAFDKSTVILSPSIGWSEMVHIPVGAGNPYNTDVFGSIKRIVPTGQISLQAEFAVQKYFGVGFIAGMGGNPSALFKEVNVPVGLFANFHFYQFIADKKGKKLHTDKLDIYAGIMAGAGLAIHPYGANSLFYQSSFYDALLCIGPHIGINYYFKKNVAFNGQIGYGVNVVQVGFTFKVGNKAK